jgi:hypothetical protein
MLQGEPDEMQGGSSFRGAPSGLDDKKPPSMPMADADSTAVISSSAAMIATTAILITDSCHFPLL